MNVKTVPMRCLFGRVQESVYLSDQEFKKASMESVERIRRIYNFDVVTRRPIGTRESVCAKQCLKTRSSSGSLELAKGLKPEWHWEELDIRNGYIPKFYMKQTEPVSTAHAQTSVCGKFASPTALTTRQGKAFSSSSSDCRPPQRVKTQLTSKHVVDTQTLFKMWQPRIQRHSLPTHFLRSDKVECDLTSNAPHHEVSDNKAVTNNRLIKNLDDPCSTRSRSVYSEREHKNRCEQDKNQQTRSVSLIRVPRSNFTSVKKVNTEEVLPELTNKNTDTGNHHRKNTLDSHLVFQPIRQERISAAAEVKAG
ncbi:uncharacterized protein DEA37_0013508 [Paragonimus westermani]|uniref:Uncharacterized protein n=1 Tax=Paragonimus westermani TaxID=34504 RepID=A0A5J4NK50_9TREM|nr:uncharacterized protein DEA37_0013508 [Paragonimus westermani]